MISYEMHERVFRKMTILPFPCLVKLLCDEENILDILGVNVRVESTGIACTIMINDPAIFYLSRRSCTLPVVFRS